jgi:hypothetical protein
MRAILLAAVSCQIIVMRNNLMYEAKILFILKYLLSEDRLCRKVMTFAINDLKEKRLGQRVNPDTKKKKLKIKRHQSHRNIVKDFSNCY